MILITFEGIDGSGKSTQARRLIGRLEDEGYDVASVREPGGTPLSEAVRTLLLDPGLTVGDLPELLLFSAARAQLVEERIKPALAAGTIVVCDRFYDSTTAYQGGGREVVAWDWLRAFNLRVTGGLEPDRTYLLSVDPGEALRRRTDRSRPDRMEQGDRSFYDRVSAAYDQLAEEESGRIVRLDGGRSVDDLSAEIWTDVRSLLARR